MVLTNAGTILGRRNQALGLSSCEPSRCNILLLIYIRVKVSLVSAEKYPYCQQEGTSPSSFMRVCLLEKFQDDV